MSQEFSEGDLTFAFPDRLLIRRPQDLAFYKNQFQNMCGGCKETDFIAYDQGTGTLWLLEIKDFRVGGRLKPTDLHKEVAEKVRDTLALIIAGGLSGMSNEDQVLPTLRGFWNSARGASSVRVVLHLEQPAHTSKLFPGISNLVSIDEQLRRAVRAVDPHAVVMNDNSVPGIPWKVT